ncbi:hypothetical protein ES705_39194 [subsurface metagenome]
MAVATLEKPAVPPAQSPHYPAQSSETVAHCKLSQDSNTFKTYSKYGREQTVYGVPQARRLITPEIYNKRRDLIRDYLRLELGMHAAEYEAILRILKLYVYYGKVYPKAQQIATDSADPLPPSILPSMGIAEPQRHHWGCSKRSFWRAIAILKEQDLIEVMNRYLHGKQISNNYRLDKLVLILVRYIAEHREYLDRFAAALFDYIGASFWQRIWQLEVRLAAAEPIQLRDFK